MEQDIEYAVVNFYLDEGLEALKITHDTTNEKQRHLVTLLDKAENFYLSKINKTLTDYQICLIKEMVQEILKSVTNPVEALEEIISLAPYTSTDLVKINYDLKYLARKADQYKFGNIIKHLVLVYIFKEETYVQKTKRL